MRVLSQEKQARLAALLRSGASVRATAVKVPCSQRTVTHYRRMFLGDTACRCGRPATHFGWCFAREFPVGQDAPKCGCGKPASHRGWCAVRFARSPKRQEVLARWGKGPKAKPASVLKSLQAPAQKPFSMFDGLPRVSMRQNAPWRRLDMVS